MTRACLFGENPITKLDEEYAIDPSSKALVVVPRELIARVKSKFFNLAGTISNLPDAGATAYFLAKAPVGVCIDIHSLGIGTTGGPIIVKLCEAPTLSNLGTPIIPVNYNRVTNIAAAVQVWSNPTVTATGVVLSSQTITGEKHLGGEGESLQDWLLKPDTYYLFSVQNVSGAVVDITYSFNWIEIEA